MMYVKTSAPGLYFLNDFNEFRMHEVDVAISGKVHFIQGPGRVAIS